MYVLFETPAGFALFKVLKEDKLKKTDNLYKEFENIDKAEKIVKLKAFKKFNNTKEAMKSFEKLIKGELSKKL